MSTPFVSLTGLICVGGFLLTGFVATVAVVVLLVKGNQPPKGS